MTDLTIVEYKKQRVLTTHQLAEAYEADSKVMSNNFNRNKNRYTEGKHYICLTGNEKREFLNHHKIDDGLKNATAIYLWMEKGALLHAKSLNTDKAWEVYENLVDGYFKAHEVINEELSPNLKFMKSIVEEMERKELEDIERDKKIAQVQQMAQKAIESTEVIKEAVTPIIDNWRIEIYHKICRVQARTKIDFQTLNTKMYSELERRAGVNLDTRLKNLKKRMMDNDKKKSEIDGKRKIDCIEEDKKLREIFSKIVSEYEVKYCA